MSSNDHNTQLAANAIASFLLAHMDIQSRVATALEKQNVILENQNVLIHNLIKVAQSDPVPAQLVNVEQPKATVTILPDATSATFVPTNKPTPTADQQRAAFEQYIKSVGEGKTSTLRRARKAIEEATHHVAPEAALLAVWVKNLGYYLHPDGKTFTVCPPPVVVAPPVVAPPAVVPPVVEAPPIVVPPVVIEVPAEIEVPALLDDTPEVPALLDDTPEVPDLLDDTPEVPDLLDDTPPEAPAIVDDSAFLEWQGLGRAAQFTRLLTVVRPAYREHAAGIKALMNEMNLPMPISNPMDNRLPGDNYIHQDDEVLWKLQLACEKLVKGQ